MSTDWWFPKHDVPGIAQISRRLLVPSTMYQQLVRRSTHRIGESCNLTCKSSEIGIELALLWAPGEAAEPG